MNKKKLLKNTKAYKPILSEEKTDQQLFLSLTAKDIDRFKSKADPSKSDICISLSLLYLLADVTVDLFPDSL